MADENDDDTCDQTGQKSGQGNQEPDQHGGESITHQDNAVHSLPVNSKDTPLASAQSHNLETSPLKSKGTPLEASAQSPNVAETPPLNSEDTPLTSAQSHNLETVPLNIEGTPMGSAQSNNVVETPLLNSKDTSLSSAQSHSVVETPTLSSEDAPLASAQSHKLETSPLNSKDTSLSSAQSHSVVETSSLNRKDTLLASAQSHNLETSPLNFEGTSLSSAQSHSVVETPPLNSQATLQSSAQSHNVVETPPGNSEVTHLTSAQSQNDETPTLNRKNTSLSSTESHNVDTPPVNSEDTPLNSAQSHDVETPTVNSKDTFLPCAQSHGGESSPGTIEHTALATAQSQNGQHNPDNSKGTPLSCDQSHDGESSPETSEHTILDSAKSHNGQHRPENSKDTPLSSSQSHDGEKTLPVHSKDTSQASAQSHTGESSPVNSDSPLKGLKDWRYAAIGMAAGAAAVVAAPVVLGAAGITAGGVAAGSIAATLQTVFYGAAGKAAIGGITGGIAALGTKMFDNRTDIKLLICGCGSEAHVFAGIASSLQGTQVRMLTSSKLLTDRWNKAVDRDDLEVIFHRKGLEPTSITSKPGRATNDPEEAMQDVDIVAFLLPAFAHEVLLDSLKPYIKPGIILVGLPGGPGFEFQVREVLGDLARQCTIVNFESPPWVCRTTAFGLKCEVLGTMETLLGAMKQGEDVAHKKDPVSTLQYLLGPLPNLNISGHLLGVQLMSTSAYIHTSLLYGQWEGWGGKPLDEPPLFYNGLTESTANLLSSISDEVVNIGNAVELNTEADMSNVVHIHQWHVRRYPHDISIKSTLYKAIQTNAAYQGLRHPVKTTEDGKFVPDFTRRFMTEDVPYGLVVIRGIAEIVGVKTPNIDKVLTWCQEKMGKEYLVNSKLQGKDVWLTRAPQRYGFTTLESIL